MKSLTLLLYSLTLLFASTIQAEDNSADNLFEQANIAYTRADYQQAINHYLTVIGKDGISAPLLYNLANSYAATDQVGRAVVNYERALRLSPGDADIQANLDQVRKDAGLYRDDKPLYERFAELLEADQWLMLSGAAFLLLAITTLAANLVSKISPALIRLIIISSLLVSITTLPPSIFRYRSWNDGVVMGQETRLLISPFSEASSTGTIKAGRLVSPGKTHGDFVLVRDETGRSGWLGRDSFELIVELPNK
jgi:tetratricopeptide (TPR) repeat protein